jgi:chromate reductase, NAD(P)H dehydrogenase (quinone)
VTGPRVLVLPGSTRTGSFNAKLAALITKELVVSGTRVTSLSFADYVLPLYDADLETSNGVPAAATALARQFAAHEVVLLVSPEYNAGISPLVKNAIDWISRVRETGLAPYSDRLFALASASPGNFGGIRGLLHVRQSLELGLGALVAPEQFLLPRARVAFNEGGELVETADAARLRKMLVAVVRRARFLTIGVE